MEVFTIIGKEYDSNIYIVLGETPTVIDTGTGFHSKELRTTIQKFVQPSAIQQIVLTHEHYDHVGGAADLLEFTGGHAKILAHSESVQKLKTGKSSFAELLGGVMPKLHVDIALAGGEHLMIGDEIFEVLTTPGHSLGSICLYEKKNKTLFSGDTIFANGGFGRYDFPGGDFLSLVKSLERLAALKVDFLYPGHGPIIDGNAHEHIEKSYLNIQSMM